MAVEGSVLMTAAAPVVTAAVKTLGTAEKGANDSMTR
jgi:hypothetical protein